MDRMGTCDGFCEIEIGGRREKTHTIKDSYNPEWNETFEFEARGGDMRIRVFDWDFVGGNDVVGDAFITHTQMMLVAGMGREETMHLELKTSDGALVKGHDKETSIITVSLKVHFHLQRSLPPLSCCALIPKPMMTLAGGAE
eukprot:3116206-Rhodomonas_salina.1